MPFRVSCLPALSLLALLRVAAPATAAELHLVPPGLAYCEELAARFARLPRARQDISRGLANEGSQLCHDGHLRTGVAKLRRALRAAQPPGS